MGEPLEHDWSAEDIKEHHDGHELELEDSDLTSFGPHSVKSSEATLAQTTSSEHAISEVSIILRRKHFVSDVDDLL